MVIQLKTFLGWGEGITNVIGYKAEHINGTQQVVKVWCKTCARYEQQISSSLKGKAFTDFQKYVSGTTFITKHTVMRHLESNVHRSGADLEKLAETELGQKLKSSSSEQQQHQPKINTSIHSAAKNAYRKFIRTAYILAARGQPLSTFKAVVQIQKANGVQLISGVESVTKASEMVDIIACQMKLKITEIVKESNFFALLSDGSQARKTNSEKELVYIRVVKNGSPVYFCVALQNIDDYGNATAKNIKESLDDVFKEDTGQIKLPIEAYQNKMVCATSDGAAVNTGVYSGVLNQLKLIPARPWLITIHCVSHRLELAIKYSISKQTQFESLKDFMVELYYYCKRSGKFVRQMHDTATVWGLHAYKFPKTHGTRFVNHQRQGLSALLNNWVILLLSIENSLASEKQDAKRLGYLKKLKNFTFLSHCCLYKQLLDKLAVLSLEFEKGSLLVFEILSQVENTIVELEDIDTQSVLEACNYSLDGDKIVCKLLKAGHKRKSNQNQEYTEIEFSGMTYIAGATENLPKLKEKAVSCLKDCLIERFQSFRSDLFQSCQWLDPANWQDDPTDELKAIQNLATHFKIPLTVQSFEDNESKLSTEWKLFKRTAANYYSRVDAKAMWKKMIQFRRHRFPNMCLLAEIVLCLGMSNSTVEGGFSHLTRMLPDSRLSLKHSNMENLLLIKINDLVFTPNEKEAIIEATLDDFMSSRRKYKLHTDTMDIVLTRNPRMWLCYQTRNPKCPLSQMKLNLKMEKS